MPDSDRYFELNDDVGVTVDGNLEPLAEIGLVVNVPVMTGGEVVDSAHRITIGHADRLTRNDHARVISGTRIVHCTDPRVADGLLQTGSFHEVDPPTKKAVTEQVKTTRDAREEAGTHTESDEEATV
jgi:hypothetical protein